MSTTLMDRHSAQYRQYRRLRTNGVRPAQAVFHVRNDAKLATAEMNDEITFNREYDPDYQPERGWCNSDTLETITEMERFYDEECKKLYSGEWAVYGITAKRKQDACCRLCRTPADRQARTPWDSDIPTEASLWGIVVDNGPEGDMYLREVEIELAMELGVI